MIHTDQHAVPFSEQWGLAWGITADLVLTVMILTLDRTHK